MEKRKGIDTGSVDLQIVYVDNLTQSDSLKVLCDTDGIGIALLSTQVKK